MNERCACGHVRAYHDATGCFHAKPGWNRTGRCACAIVLARVAAVVRYESTGEARPSAVRAMAGV